MDTRSLDKVTNSEKTGVFDVLLTRMEVVFKKELMSSRLTGPEYSRLFMSSYESTLMQALTFTLNGERAIVDAEIARARLELIPAEKKLLIAQAEHAEESVFLIREQVQSAKTSQELVVQQILQLQAEVSLVRERVITEQIQHKDQEAAIDIKEVTKDRLLKELDLLAVEIRKGNSEALLLEAKTASQDIIDLNLKSQTELLVSQVSTEQAKADKIAADARVTEAMLGKVAPEIEGVKTTTKLLKQQIITESKQGQLIDSNVSHIDQTTVTETHKTAQMDAEASLTKVQVTGEGIKNDLLRTELQFVDVKLEALVLDNQLKTISKDIARNNILESIQKVSLMQAQARIAEQDIKVKTAEIRVMEYQADKTDAEVMLLKAKEVTEKKQPEVANAQMGVYIAQKHGFVDDARIKSMKIMADLALSDSSGDDALKIIELSATRYAGFNAMIGANYLQGDELSEFYRWRYTGGSSGRLEPWTRAWSDTTV